MISSASNKRVTNAVGGKTARACESCVKKRARWYCAADDAFLCQSCDSSVHSANSMAVRHERVRLQTASFKSLVANVPSWPQRKARTRRHGKSSRDREREVPEVVSDDQATKEEEIEQKLIYRVPIYDDEEEESLRDFIASEMDMEEFAADVESLLGRGVNEELGFVTYCNKKENSKWMVKEEEMMTLELGFDFDEEELSPELCWGGGDDREVKDAVDVDKKKHKLRLDYEAVISAWGCQGDSPWTTGCRPNYWPDQSWPNCLGTCETEFQDPSGEHINGIGGGQTGILGDGDREARVSRYREKRRTRLFSKKIRYEVRKLNAEKRPRMKGRFVKRSIFSGSAFPLLSQ